MDAVNRPWGHDMGTWHFKMTFMVSPVTEPVPAVLPPKVPAVEQRTVQPTAPSTVHQPVSSHEQDSAPTHEEGEISLTPDEEEVAEHYRGRKA
eukprot:CAMPEP_0170221056 /NCGR_PEP_ID=MMETSP0116_2-20130129/10216_1 /TAXON_ID=400756 /ORGANISM="Durinskia baltica, Strain CSIRO CS-38" /LENGTH=92 /DNA_ID=CAMNT_0010471735 /DNA_START=216 /DNA_END=494 /DNA_ORIENTATION=+